MTDALRIGMLGLHLACLASAFGCVSSPQPVLEAEGVYVRHLRVRVPPPQSQAFEAMMTRLVEAATRAGLPEEYDWLCNREPPDRYWLLFFSDSATGFATPSTLRGMVDRVGPTESRTAHAEIMEMFAGIKFETDWEILIRQKESWSTVREMSTSTHPKARIIARSIRAEKLQAFDADLSEMTAFLQANHYPLPVEGFVLHSGDTEAAWQVVFPVDWVSSSATEFSAFVSELEPAAQSRYADLEEALRATVSGSRRYDAEFARELSYQSE